MKGLVRLDGANVNIDEHFKEQMPLEKTENCQILLTILCNVQYLGRQGLVFCGNSEEGNLDQMIQLSAKIDPRVSKWLERKCKYVHGDTKMEKLKSWYLLYFGTSLKRSTKVIITPL